MKIAIGCDEAAVGLTDILRKHLKDKGIELEDYGVFSEDKVDYPDIAVKVAESVAAGNTDAAFWFAALV